MGVARRGRRRIEVDGVEYLWWVAVDDDCYTYPGAVALNVVSTDKQFVVRYHLGQPRVMRHVTVLGSVFRTIDCSGPWCRFRAPEFGSSTRISPGDVADFVRWCLGGTDAIVEVDYNGNVLKDAPKRIMKATSSNRRRAPESAGTPSTSSGRDPTSSRARRR
jgi:hypothetical protein